MELPFLGRVGRFPAGTFYLAHAAGCPILPIFSRGGMQSLEIEIGPPLSLDHSLPADQFWRAHLPTLVGFFEAQVLAHPEEWGWGRF
jgi:lauroyl/myristoyl acyltransferase